MGMMFVFVKIIEAFSKTFNMFTKNNIEYCTKLLIGLLKNNIEYYTHDIGQLTWELPELAYIAYINSNFYCAL